MTRASVVATRSKKGVKVRSTRSVAVVFRRQGAMKLAVSYSKAISSLSLISFPINAKPVLVHAGAVRPAGAQVDAHRPAVRQTGGEAGPVPETGIRPDPASQVQTGKTVFQFEFNDRIAPIHLAFNGEGVLFAGELELLFRPGNDHIQGSHGLRGYAPGNRPGGACLPDRDRRL